MTSEGHCWHLFQRGQILFYFNSVTIGKFQEESNYRFLKIETGCKVYCVILTYGTDRLQAVPEKVDCFQHLVFIL